MTLTTSLTRTVAARPAPAETLRSRLEPRRQDLDDEGVRLGGYRDRNGCLRELAAKRGSAGSVLVVDYDATRADARLVAHLGSDEPPENAEIVCRIYLQQVRGASPRCRRLTPEDLHTDPLGADPEPEPGAALIPGDADLHDRLGYSYRLERVFTGMSIPELRWRSYLPEPAVGSRTISVRDAIARLESYEPVRALTRRALAGHRGDTEVSSTVLRVELRRIEQSPIVLNRKLRDAVLGAVAREGLSMSEIAIRCGRIKRDRSGNESGETSWLARRIGILPEGGRSNPTPWIHSDVLALIARHGLGISPREIELE